MLNGPADVLPPPALPVLVIGPPTRQAALTAALPPPMFQVTFAAAPLTEAIVPPPAVVLLSLEEVADLASVAPLAAHGAPVVVLLAVEAGLVEAALAAGASDYVYRLDNWAALLPFHLLRAAQAAQAAQVLVVQHRQALRQLAHDLRGPLSYLVGYAELLTMQDLPSEKVRQMTGEMLGEAEKLAASIDRFAPAPPPRP